MRIAAIIVAGGRGVRAGEGLPKQYRALLGKPVLRWSLNAFSTHPRIGAVCAVIDPAFADAFAAAAAGLANLTWTAGGDTRTASVRAGIEALAPLAPDVVLIHDAARPGVSAADIDALIAAMEAGAGAAAPARPLADALKRADANGLVLAEAERAGLHAVQTPQAVRYAPFRAALDQLDADAAFDDDLAIARAAGLSVRLVPGRAALAKLTWHEDFALLERLLSPPAMVSVSATGFDAHRFGPGDHVTLCGVRIPHTHGLIGHSDADAGWHALTDALLGTIGAGDIGAHFPPSDPQWKGAASERFLRRARELVAAAGGRIVHADLTLICERPKIGPHRAAMVARTAEVLDLPLARVSVKATTTERMGFTGREEGLAALATASVLIPEIVDVS